MHGVSACLPCLPAWPWKEMSMHIAYAIMHECSLHWSSGSACLVDLWKSLRQPESLCVAMAATFFCLHRHWATPLACWHDRSISQNITTDLYLWSCIHVHVNINFPHPQIWIDNGPSRALEDNKNLISSGCSYIIISDDWPLTWESLAVVPASFTTPENCKRCAVLLL
jgi:hypothetical protein